MPGYFRPSRSQVAPRIFTKSFQNLPRLCKAIPLLNRGNGTTLRGKRSNPDFVSNGKCKTRIAGQGITTFPDFAHRCRPSFGIIVCTQNSHSRPGNTKDCQCWRCIQESQLHSVCNKIQDDKQRKCGSERRTTWADR